MKLIAILEATLKDIQRKIPIWTKKYKQEIPEDILSQIVEPDPTKGKYSEWLIRQYLNKTTNFPEDNEELKRNLELFHTKKSKLTNKDINQYTPQSLADALDQELGLTKSERKAARRGDLKLPPGAEVIAEDDSYQGVKVTDVNAAIKLSSGTKWCTANEDYAADYLERGALFVIYKDGKRVALVHYESDQWMNVDNEDVREVDKSSFVDYVNLLSGYTGVGFEDDPMLAYYYAKYVIKGRWSEGESVIVKDLAGVDNESAIDALPGLAAVEYARDVIGGRWPEIERILMVKGDTELIVIYVKDVIKGRWSEAEPTIMKNSHSAYEYAKDIIKGRWSEAEPIIMKNPHSAYEYAKNVIGGRWFEAEPIIMKYLNIAVMYAYEVIKGRWPEAEPTIIKSPWHAYSYAKNVIKGRWLEAESSIMQDEDLAERYRKDVLIPAYQKSLE